MLATELDLHSNCSRLLDVSTKIFKAQLIVSINLLHTDPRLDVRFGNKNNRFDAPPYTDEINTGGKK
jgi:hypothetical protein